MWLYNLAGILLIFGLPIAVIGATISVYRSRKDKSLLIQRWREVAIGIVVFICMVAFFKWDPNDVLGWYLD